MASLMCFRETVFNNQKNNMNPVNKYSSMTCNCIVKFSLGRLCFLQGEDKKTYAYKIHQCAFEYKAQVENCLYQDIVMEIAVARCFPFEQ